MDFVADFAQPLPAIVIAEMIGIPPEDGANFQRWSDDVIRFLGGTFGSIAEDARRANEGAVKKACGMSRTSAPSV
jgi:cytochrome P450